MHGDSSRVRPYDAHVDESCKREDRSLSRGINFSPL